MAKRRKEKKEHLGPSYRPCDNPHPWHDDADKDDNAMFSKMRRTGQVRVIRKGE